MYHILLYEHAPVKYQANVFSHENLTFLHVKLKITLLLRLHIKMALSMHHFYCGDFVIFVGVYVINRILQGEIRISMWPRICFTNI